MTDYLDWFRATGRKLVFDGFMKVAGVSSEDQLLPDLKEQQPVNPIEIALWRPAHEQRVLATAASGVRAVVARPGIVYGGARGIVDAGIVEREPVDLGNEPQGGRRIGRAATESRA